MHRNNINKYEINPDLYRERQRDIRRSKIEEAVGGIVLLVILGVVGTMVQVAYGIW